MHPWEPLPLPRIANRGPGLELGAITHEAFRDFARHHATSPEIGRIATALDDERAPLAPRFIRTIGLSGCGKLCGVACCTVTESRIDGTHACKLDSVIVDAKLRRRGLASALVTSLFVESLQDPDFSISSIYAHAVHPGTERLLDGLSFRKGHARGAPISSIRVEPEGRDRLMARCQDRLRGISARLKLGCVYCLKGDKRARPWCMPGRR